LQVGSLARPPGLDQQRLTTAQRDRLATGQHMVGAVAAAGEPHPAAVHPQPARTLRLQLQHAAQVQLARDGRQALQGTGLMQMAHGSSRMTQRPEGATVGKLVHESSAPNPPWSNANAIND
jgi:hypothetical protein